MEYPGHPVGGIDYPQTFQEFEAWFSDEEACRNYLRHLRWPTCFVCPHCGSEGNPWTTKRGLLHCRACQGQTSVIAGTIFEGTRKPLKIWFLAMWFVTSQKNGTSALGLQRVLGLGSYQTAWAWLHKLRRAMIRPGRDGLSGTVEVDETYVGGPEEALQGREIENKSIVVIAAEKRGRGMGRIRLARVKDVSAKSLLPFIQSAVTPGSVIHTDGWPAYSGVKVLGYKHQVTVLKHSILPTYEVMPRVHRVASLLKRWLIGTLHGGVQATQLDYYLDEFTFRFNRRNSRARGLLFHRLAQHAVATEPAPYQTLVAKGSQKVNHKSLD